MTAHRPGSFAIWLCGCTALFITAAVVLPFIGPSRIDVGHVWNRQNPDWSILTQLRTSRTLLGLFAGGALALAGSLFQSMLRDALATPYTLGVSTGASLGAVLAIAGNWHMTMGVTGVWAGALTGAALVLLLVMGAARRDRQLSVSGLLLAGIAINSICGALILLVHGLTGVSQSFAISRWLIGSLDAIEFRTLAVYVTVISMISLVTIRQARQWNLLAVGEAWAATRGARVTRALVGGYLAGSVLAATTVALTGPIGFVGLVVPHLLRARMGGDDRLVMPCAFLVGGALLASCDALGRVVLAPAEVPAGAITAFIGGPHLIWAIRKGTTR
ncbi:MAG: iron ABC transporter permease [Acidimicrobiia bacterium]|nr:iron ABC transporter permease [Acidimicrobiia bacterium]